MLECKICNGKDAILAVPNGFVLAFPARQCSQAGCVTLASGPKRHTLANLVILSCPMWRNLTCRLTESISTPLLDVAHETDLLAIK